VLKGDDLTTFIVPKVEKILSPNLPEALGPPRPVAGQLYLFIYYNLYYNNIIFYNIEKASFSLHAVKAYGKMVV
jgi:hypothetical protein